MFTWPTPLKYPESKPSTRGRFPRYLVKNLSLNLGTNLSPNLVNHQIGWWICHQNWWPIWSITKFGDKFRGNFATDLANRQISWWIQEQISWKKFTIKGEVFRDTLWWHVGIELLWQLKMTCSPGQTRSLMWIDTPSNLWAKICQSIFFQILVGTWWYWVSRGQYL